jgi:phosphoribosylanthranilate isomerase
MTNEEDALLAVALGADAVGFIFAPSIRRISPVVAQDIAKRLPPDIQTFGVFRDEAPQRVIDVVAFAGLKAAQLHGRETPDQARAVRRRLPFVMQAFAAADPAIARAHEYGVDAVLLDSPTPGSGRVFDWALAGEAPSGLPVMIAGGLTADNVGEAIAIARPWGVDVCSGVEKEPGYKDPVKLRSFIAAAKAAEAPPYQGAGRAPYDWQVDS